MRERSLRQRGSARVAAYLVVAAFWIFHFDLWNWGDVQPIYLGVLPVGLFYHVVHSVLAVVLMPVVFHVLWPDDPSLVRQAEGRGGAS